MVENDFQSFQDDRRENIEAISRDMLFSQLTREWLLTALKYKYSYNFDWLGLPIIQFPQDIVAVQEIIWKTKPDVIIETGVARGGSLTLSASILHLLNGRGKVVGVDIDIRAHNRKAIEDHPLAFRIKLVQGSSTDPETVGQVKKEIQPNDRVMVFLDSNHTHEHVLNELEFYAPFVTKDCYLVAMDTVVEDTPENFFPDRPWGPGNNPKTAVHQFLKQTDRFEIDASIHNKLLITGASDGYLKCVK